MYWLNVSVVVSTLLIILYRYLTRNNNYWELKGVPYKKPLFLFGNILDMFLEGIGMGEYFRKLCHNISGPYFGFFAFQRPFLILKDPEIIKRVLIKDFHIFRNRPFFCDERIDPIASNFLFGIKHPHWKTLRTKLSPVFTSGKMKMMMQLMKECGENLQTYIKTHLDQDVDVKEIAAKYTTDVISTCAFGINSNCLLNESKEFEIMGQNIFARTVHQLISVTAYFFAPELVKLFRLKFINPKSVEFFREVFTTVITQREATKIERNDLIDILIDLKNQNTAEDEFKFYGDRLVAQAINFFGAGYETSSSLIALTLHELCINTYIQDKLRKEVIEVCDQYGGLTYEAAQDMKYLNMVVSETLRKYPLTPFLSRTCEEDYIISETGLKIDKGTAIIIPQQGLHWNAKYFPSPEKFDPERFSDENKQKIGPYSYLPFGEGPRNCIGERFGLLSSKVGIINILRNFKISRNSFTKDPLVFAQTGLLYVEGGVRMTLTELV